MKQLSNKARHAQNRHMLQYPEHLTEVPKSEWAHLRLWMGDRMPERAWVSRRYHVQLWTLNQMHLSVCRSKLAPNGQWEDGLTWDELQAIKRAVGFGDWYAVEVYPRDQDIINEANFRHLWLFEQPLDIGWHSEASPQIAD